ncbi:MAG: hypothetical protein R3C68_09920 [Myxococcota bacterium]
MMAPHPRGEAESVAAAFELCGRAFHQFDVATIDDDDARDWVFAIQGFMDTDGFEDPSDRGLWTVKAEQLTVDEKLELSRTVDELASWFDREFWTN